MAENGNWPVFATVTDVELKTSTFHLPKLSSDTIALLQYTSGKYRQPQGRDDQPRQLPLKLPADQGHLASHTSLQGRAVAAILS